MKNLFIDVRHSFSISKKSGKFNGGNNYSKRVIKLLLDYYDSDTKMMLICTDEVIEHVKKEINDKKFVYVTVDRLADINAKENDIYYTPLLDDSLSYKKELIDFKKKNPKVKVYITIHDRRHLENWYDKYDGLLKNGMKSNPVVLAAGRFFHSIFIENSMKKSISIADKIFTVSNYSMQSLLNYKKIKYINWFYQGIYNYSEETAQSEDYLLFVSAGRPEKNLIRSLLAFEMYVKKSGNTSIKLLCVGVTKEIELRLKSKLKFDNKIFGNQIIFLDYVSHEKLNDLYAKCRFLVFVSKSEGFGLPVLEAALKCKPVLASNRTAVPEVIGAAGIYVDPFDVQSICNGIEFLMNENNYKEQILYMTEKKEILKQQIELDSKILVKEILC